MSRKKRTVSKDSSIPEIQTKIVPGNIWKYTTGSRVLHMSEVLLNSDKGLYTVQKRRQQKIHCGDPWREQPEEVEEECIDVDII